MTNGITKLRHVDNMSYTYTYIGLRESSVFISDYLIYINLTLPPFTHKGIMAGNIVF